MWYDQQTNENERMLEIDVAVMYCGGPAHYHS